MVCADASPHCHEAWEGNLLLQQAADAPAHLEHGQLTKSSALSMAETVRRKGGSKGMGAAGVTHSCICCKVG